MAEKRVWIEGGNVEAVAGPMNYIGQGSERIWIEGGNIAITGGGGGFSPTVWNSATAYIIGDVVTYNQNLYIATADNTNETPPQNSGLTHVSMQQFTPVVPINSEAGDIEIGIHFQVDQTCVANASKFYKGDSTNGGTHVGRIWNMDTATQLTSENYTGETSSGWQRQAFSSPVVLSPGINYIHSVSLPQAHYSNTAFLFRVGPFTDGPIRVGASLFHDNTGSMPNTVFNDTFYFNAVEVNINIGSSWQLLAKGDWGNA